MIDDCSQAKLENIFIKNTLNHRDSDLIVNVLTNAVIKNITILNTNNIKRKSQSTKLEFLSNIIMENFNLLGGNYQSTGGISLKQVSNSRFKDITVNESTSLINNGCLSIDIIQNSHFQNFKLLNCYSHLQNGVGKMNMISDSIFSNFVI